MKQGKIDNQEKKKRKEKEENENERKSFCTRGEVHSRIA